MSADSAEHLYPDWEYNGSYPFWASTQANMRIISSCLMTDHLERVQSHSVESVNLVSYVIAFIYVSEICHSSKMIYFILTKGLCMNTHSVFHLQLSRTLRCERNRDLKVILTGSHNHQDPAPHSFDNRGKRRDVDMPYTSGHQ